MSTVYQSPTTTVPRVQELPTITATELKNATADVFEQVAAKQAIAITRHEKPRAILLSVEQYEALTGHQPEWLEKLHEEYRGMLERMQGPEQRAAAERAFNATPEQLGKAAVWAAQQKAHQKTKADNV
jgi:prevent-host-death family protein